MQANAVNLHGLTKELAEKAVAEGADLVAFGVPFLPNLDYPTMA